jgi:hypothetical protein
VELALALALYPKFWFVVGQLPGRRRLFLPSQQATVVDVPDAQVGSLSKFCVRSVAGSIAALAELGAARELTRRAVTNTANARPRRRAHQALR